MYNKNQYRKFNDKKILHKVKKQWVNISLALFMMVGGEAVATHINASANTANQNQTMVKVQSKVKPNNQSQAITNSANKLHSKLINRANISTIQLGSNHYEARHHVLRRTKNKARRYKNKVTRHLRNTKNTKKHYRRINKSKRRYKKRASRNNRSVKQNSYYIRTAKQLASDFSGGNPNSNYIPKGTPSEQDLDVSNDLIMSNVFKGSSDQPDSLYGTTRINQIINVKNLNKLARLSTNPVFRKTLVSTVKKNNWGLPKMAERCMSDLQIYNKSKNNSAFRTGFCDGMDAGFSNLKYKNNEQYKRGWIYGCDIVTPIQNPEDFIQLRNYMDPAGQRNTYNNYIIPAMDDKDDFISAAAQGTASDSTEANNIKQAFGPIPKIPVNNNPISRKFWNNEDHELDLWLFK